MKLPLLFLLLLWLWAKKVVVELGVWDGEIFPRLCGKILLSKRLEPISSQGLQNLKFNVRPGGIGLFFYNID